MFDSLDQRIKDDEKLTKTAMHRALYGASVLIVSILVFTGLYLGILFLES
jgi:hypothetical protein